MLKILTILLGVAIPIFSINIKAHDQTTQIEISKYVYGRTLTLNPCYKVFNDEITIFTIAPELLTIKTCNTHTCKFTLTGDAFHIISC
jgi:hypothetical protein